MCKFIWAALSVFVVTSVVACAGAGANSLHVKCPACGYTFDVHNEG